MNMPQVAADIAVQVVSVDPTPPGGEPGEMTDEPRLEDMGQGLQWGMDCATTLAYTSKRECWVVNPVTAQVLFRVCPADIVIH